MMKKLNLTDDQRQELEEAIKEICSPTSDLDLDMDD